MYDEQYKSNNQPPQQYAYYGQPAPQQQYNMYNQSYYPEANAPPNAGAQQVNAIKPETAPSTGWRDWPFALAFVVNVGVIIALMVIWGIKSLDESEEDKNSDKLMSAEDTKTVIGFALGVAVLSVVLALALVKLIVAYARCMINFVLWFNVALGVAVAAYGFAISNLFIGIIGALLALLNLCYARAVQHRIPFAVANLRVAEAAISKHKTTYCVSILFTFVQVAWVVVWALALLGVANNLSKDSNDTTGGSRLSGDRCSANSQCASNSCRYLNGYYQCYGSSSSSTFYKESPGNYAAYFFMLLSFYWGLQVFKNMAHTTVAGTVATFWYNAESAGATGASLKRTCTTSFGSICFGSLLVAVLQALRSLAENSREEGSILACFAECILGCLQAIMEYFNRWAYVYVGIYGYKFTQAGKAVFQLFHQRGFDAIINDDLIGNVLGFAALGVGLICAGAGAALSEAADIVSFQNATVFMAILGFFVGIGVAVTPLAVIDSSVATIFVCFAEDPAAFMQSHPDLYQPLVTEWHNLYPEIMVQAGYWYA